MRDDDAARPRPDPSSHSMPPVVVVRQPDPMLAEQPAGWFRVAITALGAAVVVVLVLYGLTRPPEQQPMTASSEEPQTAPAGGGAASNAGGQTHPANIAAQNPQPNAPAPTTTGQGAGDGATGQSGAAKGPPKGQAGQSKTPPASGSSSSSDTGPGAKPSPAAK